MPPDLYWDAVDAAENDHKFIDKLDTRTLPDSLQNKNKEELKKIITEKKNKRTAIQKEIGKLSAQRESYIAAEKIKKVSNSQAATLIIPNASAHITASPAPHTSTTSIERSGTM